MDVLFSHPATIHIPLALAMLMPLFFVVTFWHIQKQKWPNSSWNYLLALAAIQLVTSGFAYWSGYKDKFLSAADAQIIQRHESAALWFCGIWFLIVFAFLASRFSRPKQIWPAILAFVLLVAQAVIAIQLGHLGGQLVF